MNKKDKLSEKRNKLAAKRDKLAEGLGKPLPAAGETTREPEMRTPNNNLAAAASAVVAILALAGCQNADPASRSNRTSYRDIVAEIRGSSNTINVTVGDGLYASADGGGDKNDSAATQTTDTKPEVAVGVGGGSAGTGGATPSSGIAGEALNKLMGIVSGKAPAGTTLTAEEAQAVSACANGACSEPK